MRRAAERLLGCDDALLNPDARLRAGCIADSDGDDFYSGPLPPLSLSSEDIQDKSARKQMASQSPYPAHADGADGSVDQGGAGDDALLQGTGGKLAMPTVSNQGWKTWMMRNAVYEFFDRCMSLVLDRCRRDESL
jgi:hypothetical protein